MADEAPKPRRKPGPDPKKLTTRERRLAIEMTRQPTNKAAAIAAGYAPSRADHVPSEKMRDPDFRQHYRALMEQAGISDAAIIQKLAAGTEAMQYGLTRNGDAVEMGPDWHARAKILDMAAKVWDMYPNPRLDVNARVTGAVVVLREQDGLATGDPWAGDWIDGESHPVE